MFHQFCPLSLFPLQQEVTASPLEDLHEVDEMEMSEEERESSLKGASKRARLDNENLKASLENSRGFFPENERFFLGFRLLAGRER